MDIQIHPVKINGLFYAETTNHIHKYDMRLNGLVVFVVTVDDTDPELRLSVTGTNGKTIHTKGHTVLKDSAIIDAEGVTPYQRPSVEKIRTFIYPRVVKFMAMLYGIPMV